MRRDAAPHGPPASMMRRVAGRWRGTVTQCAQRGTARGAGGQAWLARREKAAMTRPSLVRAISSVGRAPRLHRGCRRFEPVIAHHVTAFFANDGKAHANASAISAPPREFRPWRQPEMIPVWWN